MPDAVDFEHDVLTVLRLLTEAVAAVKSMSMGGEYEDLPLWEVEKVLDRMADRMRMNDGGGADA